MIEIDDLRLILPHAPATLLSDFLPHIVAAMRENAITTVTRAAAFLGQLAHESAELKYMEEIASGAAYEGRADLGNTQPGDGKRYKGRGPIQLTGRTNYRAAGLALGLDLEAQPQMAALPEVGFRVAGWFWSKAGLNKLADMPDFRAITRVINGGYNGMEQRLAYYHRALEVIGRHMEI